MITKRVHIILFCLLFWVCFNSYSQSKKGVFVDGANIIINKDANFIISGDNGNLSMVNCLNGNHLTSEGKITINGSFYNFSKANHNKIGGKIIFENENKRQYIESLSQLYFSKLVFDNENGTQLKSNLLVSDSLELKNGILHLYDYTLCILSKGYILGSFNQDRMISTSGEGRLIKYVRPEDDFIFPVGDTIEVNKYLPIRYKVNTIDASYGANISCTVKAKKHTSIIEKYNSVETYWELIPNQISEINCDIEADLYLENYKGDVNKTYGVVKISDEVWKHIGIIKDKKIKGTLSSINTISAQELPISIYSAFSPNNDGINDYWVIPDIDKYPENIVRIYDRYGKLVYEKYSYNNDWDGRNRLTSKKLSPGTYFYRVYLAKGLTELKGSLTIVY